MYVFCNHTGIGMAEENKRKIFESFSQEDGSITRKCGGAGLGLTISSRLLELMGSKLELEGEPGKGSRFYFSLVLPIERKDNTIINDDTTPVAYS
ncbi:MAG: ATP-binding protein [Methanolobus sp.]